MAARGPWGTRAGQEQMKANVGLQKRSGEILRKTDASATPAHIRVKKKERPSPVLILDC